jgi:hypothetical protein
MFWPQFDQKFQTALQSNPPTTTPVARSDSSMLAEILDNTRSLTGRLVNVEAHLRNEANPGMAGFYRPDLFIQEANKKLTQLVVEWVNDSGLTPTMIADKLRSMVYSEETIARLAYQVLLMRGAIKSPGA